MADDILGFQLDQMAQALDVAIQRGMSLEAACAHLESINVRQYGRHPDLLKEYQDALAQAYELFKQKRDQVEYAVRHSLRYGVEHWYLGPTGESVSWNSLMRRLREGGRSKEEIHSVDKDSTTVLGLLPRPSREDFSARGLVVGHVQSGKTGNIAAVITKAADTEYKFFVILSGMTSQLRQQTQARLTADVVAAHPDRWHQWTVADTIDSSGEFRESSRTAFSIDHRNQIAVMKKNTHVLQRFLGKLLNTDRATLKNTPFIVIDDECDQASVNSSRYDDEVTRTNGLIRQILRTLPRVVYIGYTATPFANVLIDTSVDDDLYPRDFIHPLERPQAYFGAESLFGRSALDGEYREDDDGLDMIRIVPDDELSAMKPARGKAGAFHFAVASSLDRAIRYFILVVAVRECRGHEDEHSSMLIHTDVRNVVHSSTRNAVVPHLADLVARLGRSDADLLSELEQLWKHESDRVKASDFANPSVPFSQLVPRLHGVAESIAVQVENFQSEDRLDYSSGRKRVIVIGGNVLARGLTLHGLVVSFFLRSSSQYDTLMQMGRWFGYRAGFEDLPRVWVEDGMRENFFDLATVEADIRREIARYAEEEKSPKDFAPRIRKIPGLLITSRNKMRHAVNVSVGFSGEHIQTIRFRRADKEWLDENWEAGNALLSGLGGGKPGNGESTVFTGVPVERVLAFLDRYEGHETAPTWRDRLHCTYIRAQLGRNGKLRTWTVGVIGAANRPSKRHLGDLGRVTTVTRSAEVGSGDASIKALMSKEDLLVDVPKQGEDSWAAVKARREALGLDPLLLLYPIRNDSEPRPGAEDRAPLAAVEDVLGVGVYFPGQRGEVASYVAANLEPSDAEGEDEDPIPDGFFEGDPDPSKEAE